MDDKELDNLVEKYFSGQASEKQIEQIKDNLLNTKEGIERFIRLKKEWVFLNEDLNQKMMGSQAKSWGIIAANIDSATKSDSVKLNGRRRTFLYSAASAVATVIIMLVIQALFITLDSGEQITSIYMPKGERGQVVLPDSSIVWLNSETKIYFSSKYNAKRRHVKVEGQAYFEVKKDLKRDFIVNAGAIDILVHGTSFEVTDYHDSDFSTVILKEGSLSVLRSDSKEKLVTLVPDQKAVIKKDDYVLTNTEFDASQNLTWMYNQLLIDNDPVQDAFAKIGNWYGVEIMVESAPAELKYRIKIKSESLRELLESINKLSPIEYRISGEEVYVKYR